MFHESISYAQNRANIKTTFYVGKPIRIDPQVHAKVISGVRQKIVIFADNVPIISSGLTQIPPSGPFPRKSYWFPRSLRERDAIAATLELCLQIQIDLIGIRITATKFNRAGDTPGDPIALADLPGFRVGHI
ncbi:MAG: hypothetical protein CM15mP74_36290 [Halieaceae bacterium]|nr:MAG: hypothetical protein CM15mP74_36290 [Halieaceae bacterium]